jgi:hypothetical protein
MLRPPPLLSTGVFCEKKYSQNTPFAGKPFLPFHPHFVTQKCQVRRRCSQAAAAAWMRAQPVASARTGEALGRPSRMLHALARCFGRTQGCCCVRAVRFSEAMATGSSCEDAVQQCRRNARQDGLFHTATAAYAPGLHARSCCGLM